MATTNSLKTANQLLQAGKLDDARREYQTLIELRPNFPWNYYYLGRLFVQQGKWQDAVGQYRQAIKLNPNSASLHNSLAEALIELGELDEAINFSQKAIYLQQDWAIYHQTLALAYEAKSDFGQALTTWQKVLSLNPSHLRATQKVCWLETDVARDCVESGEKLNKEGGIKEAVEFYQQALILNPQQPMPIYRTCGNNLITLGKFEEAETVFQQLIEVHPELPDGYHGYARVTHSWADWELALKRWLEAIVKFPEHIGFQVQKGNMLINLSRFDEAEAVFQQLIEKYPNQPQGYERYAAVTHSWADWELALKRWENAIVKFPEHIGFQVNKGNILINLSRFDEAEAVFQQLIEKYPNQPQGYSAYATVTHHLADWELALKRWEEAIVKFPENINFQVTKGNVLINLSRFDEAEAVFQQLIEKYPNQPQGYQSYAGVTHHLADWELALKRWEEAIVKFPENISFQVLKGNVLINLSRFDEAEAVFQQLIEKYPNQPQGYQSCAGVTHHLADWELALKRWEEAIVKFPENISFQVLKGNVLINLSRFDEAEAVFQGLIEKYPNQPQGYQGYAGVTHHLADWELALKRWEEAIVKLPTNIGFQQQKGNVLINLSRFDEAEAVFQELKEKYPNQPQGYDGYARLAQSLRDWELALERWEYAVSQLPYNLNFIVQKGNALIKLSRFDDAEAVFQEMMERYPRNYQGYDGYGRVAHSLADWELALERWENAIAKLPHYFNFYLQKGDVLPNLFRYEEAETWWEKVIAQYPYRHEGLSRSAALARRLGNREFAWQRFEQTIEKFPWHIPAYCQAASELIAMGRFAEAEEKFLQALQRNPNHLTVLLQAGILASQQGNRELALERFERAIEFYHPLKAIDAYILAATELKYLGREGEAEAKYEQILSFHQQRGLYPEVKRLGTGLTSIQELGLLLHRLTKKQPDSVKDVVSLAKLTDKILYDWRSRYLAPVAKDAPSLLPKLKILKELFWQVIATQEDCKESNLGIVDFGYDLYLLVVAKLLNEKFLRLFSFYFYTLIQPWEHYLLVLKHFNMAIQLLEKESQRLNNSEWGRVKLLRSEIPLPLTDKLCFEGLSSSARYVIGTDEPVAKSQVQATVKYLPELMDEEKEYFEARVRALASSLKLRSRQTIEIFKDFICEPPFGVSEGYILPVGYYHNGISQEFINELDRDNAADNSGKNISYVALNITDSNIDPVRNIDSPDPRSCLEEIAASQKALDTYYEDEVVFGIPNVWGTWGAYQNYGHLLFDQIPSLILYQKLNLSCKIFVPHITDAHWEIFNALNIPKEKILVKQEHKFKYFMMGRYKWDAEMVNFYRNLRESIVAKRGDIPSEYRARYVYISRRYSDRRKMANEVEVEELMASLGFSIVYAERLSFEEKAMLMNHASVVVTPFGTGFGNCIMCHQNTNILLIYPPFVRPHFYDVFVGVLCSRKEYLLLGCVAKGGWEMNIDKLKRVITKILEDS